MYIYIVLLWLQAVRMNHKKEQVIILDEDNMLLDDKMIYTSQPKIYPFAVVLRLRVLQVSIVDIDNIEKSIHSNPDVIILTERLKELCFVYVKREKSNLNEPIHKALRKYSYYK